MATYLVVPKLGMALANATVVEWKATEGQKVEKQEPVVTIETQKTKFDMETEEPGFLHIMVPAETEVEVGRVIGMVAASADELTTLQKQPRRVMTMPVPGAELPGVASSPAGTTSQAPAPPRDPESARIRITPVARRLAEEHMVDISKVTGTGPEGRIVREDIENAISSKQTAARSVSLSEFDGRIVKDVIPLKGMRKAIAEHMHRSLSVSAQLTAIGEIDMSQAIGLRDAIVRRVPETTGRVSYTDLIVFVLGRALREFRVVNSSLIDGEIKIWDSINIGVAVALDDGLIVPVIKDADKKSLPEISQAVREFALKAREGKLLPVEVTGGTFTLTNLGAAGAGWRFETAIINQPESAILGTGGITDRAVVRNGRIVVRPIMTYSFTYDHRVIDGAVAVRFMARVVELLENPGLLAFG